jgi:hypothetical protein
VGVFTLKDLFTLACEQLFSGISFRLLSEGKSECTLKVAEQVFYFLKIF